MKQKRTKGTQEIKNIIFFLNLLSYFHNFLSTIFFLLIHVHIIKSNAYHLVLRIMQFTLMLHLRTFVTKLLVVAKSITKFNTKRYHLRLRIIQLL